MSKPENMIQSEVETLHALLVEHAHQLMRAVGVGNPCEAVKAQLEQMKDPRPGDLVVESSSWHRHHKDRQNVGRLVQILDDRGDETVFIEALDGTLVRWRNAEFLRLFPGRFINRDAGWVEDALRRHRLVLEDMFRECDGCRVKSGTPVLCDDCLERRATHAKTGRCCPPRVCSPEEQEVARQLDERLRAEPVVLGRGPVAPLGQHVRVDTQDGRSVALDCTDTAAVDEMFGVGSNLGDMLKHGAKLAPGTAVVERRR